MDADDAVERALATDRVVDITTTGRTSGEPRRIEIWQHQIDGRLYITGRPGRRGWYANVQSDPRFTLHLKRSAQADLPAIAHPTTDGAQRRAFFGAALARMGVAPGDVDRWVADSPLIEVELRDADADADA